jgi:transaldolase
MSFDLNSLRLKVPKVLRIKIFADGADRDAILKRYDDPNIAGFTTNPTLMKKSGVTDYEAFAKDVLSVVKNKQISFEVFSDEFDEMEAQAKEISSWGENVVIKIPITNTKGEGSHKLIERLAKAGVKLNVTAMTTVAQVKSIAPLLGKGNGGIASVFAGRIADSGRDPAPVMKECLQELKAYPNTELLWASPRELYNLIQAEDIGCQIITMTEDLLKKMPLLGGDLDQVSLDTVNMFYNDARAAGFNIRTSAAALVGE